jgi:hypothetical protein
VKSESPLAPITECCARAVCVCVVLPLDTLVRTAAS